MITDIGGLKAKIHFGNILLCVIAISDTETLYLIIHKEPWTLRNSLQCINYILKTAEKFSKTKEKLYLLVNFNNSSQFPKGILKKVPIIMNNLNHEQIVVIMIFNINEVIKITLNAYLFMSKNIKIVNNFLEAITAIENLSYK